jgi:phosphatidylglycerol:prolipoprotein diacylglycerol transferase
VPPEQRGASALHIFFEEPQLYINNPSLIFQFWQGGFVFYGGFLGAFLFGYLVCRFRKLNPFKQMDLYAPVASLGYAVGRMSCLAAGCCYGAPTTLPWGIIFPQGAAAPAGIALHPTQIYSSLWELLVFIVLVYREKKQTSRKPGALFGLWLVLHGVGRALVERFRDDFRGPAIFNMSISTWLSALVILGGVWLLRRPKGE